MFQVEMSMLLYNSFMISFQHGIYHTVNSQYIYFRSLVLKFEVECMFEITVKYGRLLKYNRGSKSLIICCHAMDN